MFGRETRILVVDDMSTMRTLVSNTLAEMGFIDVAAAQDGEQAWQMLDEAAKGPAAFELVIADWNMPKLSGLELLKKVRADKRLFELPFILLTAESERGHVMQAIQARVSNYVVKPFTQATLVEKLQAVHAALQKKKAG